LNAAEATAWIQARVIDDLGSIDDFSDDELRSELVEAFEFWRDEHASTTRRDMYRINGMRQDPLVASGLETNDGKDSNMSNTDPLAGTEDFEPSAVLHALALGELRKAGKADSSSTEDYLRACEQVCERHPELALTATGGPSEDVRGQEIHDAAIRLLASRGVHSPDYRQLADAYVEVAP
jgi:hypothetical protein